MERCYQSGNGIDVGRSTDRIANMRKQVDEFRKETENK
jgi:hypothetical protein